ncbi:Ycf48-like protein [Pedobacter sp. Bi27]|uniref:IPT/TIG domain-containing protein n=1 Tax=Pedobacter sp. Bi27 TaxID=2822351 RepID=UPI001DA95039|nr:IPT/TIG domain-containing protein [Pedobacter sp. Bi27]CAH0307807.1 Ycf48-like protein [Pedobacter sp. Bi27]
MNIKLLFILSLFFSVLSFNSYSQLKQVYKDTDEENELRKISLYSKSEGYITFKNWIGYTTDGGASYQKREISPSNVNFNGFQANLTFGFALTGTIAFDKNNLIVYGDYGLVPSILSSSDGGTTFKLVYHAQVSDTKFSYIVDMIFPENGSTGYAIDKDRILKTTNKGQTWTTVYTAIDSYFKRIQSSGTSFLAVTGQNGILRSTNLGNTWDRMNMPNGLANNSIQSSSFLSPTKCWVNFAGSIFSTSDAGNNWTLKNNPQYDPTNFSKMEFLDDNIGFGLGGAYNVYKTTNGGKIWEALPRETAFTYLGYQHYTFNFWNSNEFLVGGGYGLLESTTNGGGTPIPKAVFSVDKSKLPTAGTINLTNYSRTDYSYKWFKNDVLFATTYNASYPRTSNTKDIIRLEVNNGNRSESITQEITLSPLPNISSFLPQSASIGEKVTLEGTNFSGVTKVTVGGVSSSFVISSAAKLVITISNGASGDISLFTADGIARASGFTFIPPPVITSFNPLTALPNSEIIITGSNFENVKEVRFGGTLASAFRVDSPTSITATVGAGTSGKVSVTAAGGSGELVGFILQPVISSFFPKSGTINEVLTINGAGFEGITAVSIGGTPVKSFQIKSPTLITAVIGASANGNLMVSKAGGSSSMGSFTFYFTPVITSFSPQLASVGGEIKINGNNFSLVPAENIVYFGGVKAVVNSSTSTQLSVTVPVGAGYGSISVSYHQLTAYSAKPFSPLLSGNNVIANTPFKESDTEYGTYLNYGVAIGDFDSDGKLDCAIPNITNLGKSGFSILKGNGTQGQINFQDSEIFGIGRFYHYMASADMDGDGKLDVIAGAQDNSEISVFRNTSNVGGVSFDAPIKISGISVLSLIISDLDSDGKPDIISGNTIIKNSSSVGAISFFDKTNVSAEGSCTKVADLDNDGKMDLCFVSFFTGKFAILRNISTVGTIAFEAKKEFLEKNIRTMNCGDIDNDGKLDIISVLADNNALIFYKNNSIAGQINFNREARDYSTRSFPTEIGITDLDGDGKIDIVVNSREKTISVFKNTSNAGSISLADRIDQVLSTDIIGLSIADLDGDGKSDIIGGASAQTKYKTLRNLISPSPFINSFSPTVAVEGTEVTITGYNFSGVATVRFGDIDAQSFTLKSPTEIVAKVAKGSSGTISVTTSIGTGSKPGFSFGIAPKITSFNPKSGPSGTVVSIAGLNFDPVAENNVVYFGDVPAKVISATALSLVVEAPKGSKQTNISVTSNNLTAYTAMPYINTYPGAAASFDKNAYAELQKFTQYANIASLTDVDGDGILDVVTEQDASFSILRNAGVKGSVSFDQVKTFKHDQASQKIAIADFDGDGKPDFLLNNSLYSNTSNSLTIFRNTSITGQVSLADKIEVNASGIYFLTSDIDLDGRPDIVIRGTEQVAVLRNISKPGEIKFEKAFYYYGPGSPSGFITTDLDNDGRMDLVMISSGGGFMTQMRNTSLPGNISFTKVAEIAISSTTHQLRAEDLDGDGNIDLVTRDHVLNTFDIFKNTGGLLATSPTLSFNTAERWYDFTIADLDGDGKMDILGEGVGIFKNSSSSGTISFQPEAAYQNTEAGSSTIGDLDGDDRPDILLSGYPMRIYTNQIGKPIPQITSFTPKKATLDQTITISGSNFTRATHVQIGDFQAKSFVINSSSSITATLGDGGSGRIAVTTPSGIGSAEDFEYIPQPLISYVEPMISSENYSFTIRGGDFTGTTAVKFGGVPAKSFSVTSANEIYGIIGKAASGLVEVTTPIGTAKKEGYFYVPKVVIVPGGSTTLSPGASVMLNINTINDVKYQWYRNGILITGATSGTIQAGESGNYTVSSTYNNFGIWSDPIMITALASLPNTNLKIKVVNESCKKNDDGLIEVIAVQALKYTARLYSNGDLIKTTTFTQSTNFNNLGSGSYTVCVTHEDDANYNKCFTVAITEPKDVVLTSSTINPDQSVTLMMAGADLYFISLNGKSYQSNTGEITLPLSAGSNDLKISTATACQGIIEKKIILEGNIKAYPNPFETELNIELPIDPKVPNITIQVYDQAGKKVYEKVVTNSGSYLRLNLASLPPGIFVLRTLNGQNILKTKIIKK